MCKVWQREDVAFAFLDERSLMVPYRREQLEITVRLLRRARTPIRTVLDMGCGGGEIVVSVLNSFPDANGIGLDFSQPMLERARERHSNLDGRVEWVEADLSDSSWQSKATGPFDAVVSGYAIHHLPDQRKITLYEEIFAALSPGGVFVNCEHVASPNSEVEAMFDEALTEHLYQRRRERGEDVSLEQVRHDYINRPDRDANILVPVEEQVRWLCNIGFIDADCFWKWFELAIFGGFKKVHD